MDQLALTIIVKDEAHDLARLLQSAQSHVDGIYVVCTDKRAYKAIRRIVGEHAGRLDWNVTPYEWIDDFADARNFAMQQVPKSFEWVIWADADDVIVGPDIRRYLKGAERLDCLKVAYRTLHGHEHWHRRIVRNRAGWHWEGIIHEVLVHTGSPRFGDVPKTTYLEERPKSTTAFIDPAKRLRMVEREFERSKSARALYYLAREQMEAGNILKAINCFELYIRKEDAWEEEKYQAYRMLANCYERVIDDRAARTMLAAAELFPDAKEAYFDLARHYYFKNDWQRVIRWTEMGQCTPGKRWEMTHRPEETRSDWIIYYEVALMHTGRHREAIYWALRALELDPDAPYHKENIKRCKKALK